MCCRTSKLHNHKPSLVSRSLPVTIFVSYRYVPTFAMPVLCQRHHSSARESHLYGLVMFCLTFTYMPAYLSSQARQRPENVARGAEDAARFLSTFQCKACDLNRESSLPRMEQAVTCEAVEGIYQCTFGQKSQHRLLAVGSEVYGQHFMSNMKATCCTTCRTAYPSA